MLVADWLVQQTGHESLLKFFRLGAPRDTFDDAFQDAFGFTVSEAAQAIDAHLSEVAPPFPWRVEGIVLDPDGAPAANLFTTVEVDLDGETWSVSTAITDPDGAFAMLAPDRGHTLAVFLRCPATPGVLGRTPFVGEFGADGFTPDADEDGLLTDSDERATPFPAATTHRTDLRIQLPVTTAALTATYCD